MNAETPFVGPHQRVLAEPVEVFCGIITRLAIRRGSFDSVKQLVGAISTFINGRKRPMSSLDLDQD